jgi:hypothetical protein
MFEADVTKPRSRFARLHQIRLPLWVTVLLLVLMLALLASRELVLKAAEERLEAERQSVAKQLEDEKVALRANAREANESAYELFGKALAWAVRTAMMRRNFDEIEQYFAALTSDPHITLALLVDQKGKILLASDRQLQDAQFSAHFPAALLQTPDVAIERGEGNERRLVLPVQGLNKRLGTVLVVYTET